MASSSSAAVRSSPREKCEVFLNFRGPDSRNSFISHLHEALENREIITFLDDKKLEHGAPISQGLLKAIEESSVAVIILSTNYASSHWCLDELVNIMEHRDERGQTVIPVFYGVEPSTIRYQKRSFDEAFREHEARYGDDVEGMRKVQRWRTALIAVAELRGYDTSQRSEAEIIKQIVNQISSILCKSKSGENLQLLNKLRKFLTLQDVLNVAENKHAFNPNAPHWLNELRQAVDRAENLMEEVNYEVLRIKVEDKHQDIAESSNQHISDLYSCLSDDFFLSIKKRLKQAVEALEESQNQIGDLDKILTESSLDSGKQKTRSPSTSIVDEYVIGRRDEIEELVDRLLSANANENNLTVVPIVGMGGIGKTTLAQAAYNDMNVEGHFDLKAWFCVSEPYDTLAITKGLLQEIGLFDSKNDTNLNQLQIKLQKGLNGKKFLIVLDDVWNDKYSEWDELRKLFLQGKTGSKIIVTTRKETVANMMGREAINVTILSSEASWDLFKRHSLENKDPEEHAELEEIGKQIAKKCGGLPLALKALGGMMRSKSGVEGWTRILKSEIWELPDNDIMPALRLSYNDLPPHLNRCFSYCAIYPKDYPFCKEQVIQLWIANGLVQQRLQNGKIIEDLGNQYFHELISRSLLEKVPKSLQREKEHFLMYDLVKREKEQFLMHDLVKREKEQFLMHDLVNDLARIGSSKLCFRLEENQGSLEQCRHLSYLIDDFGDSEKLKPLCNLEQLRTLLPVSTEEWGYFSLSRRVLHNILPTLTSLRALSLSGYPIKELPNELFIKLKLLRFLDLSRTKIKQLPDSVYALYSLEALLLSSCEELEELPPQIENLINLRHLDISDTPCLKKLLPLSKLKSIRVLLGVTFSLDGCSGSRIEDLGGLHNLYGSLSISELQHVVDGSEALKARLREKEHVEVLSLEWSGGSADSSQNQKNILDKLRPNTSIKGLNIYGYNGTSFPDWLADESFLKQLVTLCLSCCWNCYSLPALGQLPSLKFLSIRGMDGITMVTEEFFGVSKKPFNALEMLEFAEMPEWKEWRAPGIGEFPVLQELLIKDCPKLIGKLPENLCSLTRLKISGCPQLIVERHIHLLSLKELEVEHCDSLTCLPFSSLPSTLKEIRLRGCGKLKLELSFGEMMSRGCNVLLDCLELEECNSIDLMSEELIPRARTLIVYEGRELARFVIPAGTEDLKIRNCENLEMLSVPLGTQMILLHRLDIRGCEKLTSLPDGMQELLPSLKELVLRNCPGIESFPEGGLPFNLEFLWIEDCKKLVNGRKEWGLQRLSCLRKLSICHDGSDEEIVGDEKWELPSSIQTLTMRDLKTLDSRVLKSLTSLEYLGAWNLPQIKSLLEEGLPPSISRLRRLFNHEELHSLPAQGLQYLTSLQKLHIYKCNQLQSLQGSTLPSSLSELVIENCLNFQTLGESTLPSSLSELVIENCLNFQTLGESVLPSSLSMLFIRDCLNFLTLGESVLPSSLSVLSIRGCPNLQSLPVRGMPSSISYLSIQRCPLVEPLLEFEKGDYWEKVADIPTIDIHLERR